MDSIQYSGALAIIGALKGFSGEKLYQETRLVNFPKFDEFLPHFLYGQILHRRNFLTKEL